MPPNTKKCCPECIYTEVRVDQPMELNCKYGGNHSCHLPPKPTEKYEDGCVKADNIGEGHSFLKGCSKFSPETNPSTPAPAVEDWIKDFDKEFGEHHCVYNGDYKSFIRSLLKSDRKRIVEELEKMKKERPNDEYQDEYPSGYNQAISDAIHFITNLK